LFSGKASFFDPPRSPAPAGAFPHFFVNKLGKIPDKSLSKNHSFFSVAGASKRGYQPSAIYPL